MQCFGVVQREEDEDEEIKQPAAASGQKRKVTKKRRATKGPISSPVAREPSLDQSILMQDSQYLTYLSAGPSMQADCLEPAADFLCAASGMFVSAC